MERFRAAGVLDYCTMLPLFALATLASNAVPLTPFGDDGGTRTRPLQPTLLALKGRGATKVGDLRVGSRAFRVEVRAGAEGAALFVDTNGDGRVAPGERVAWTRRDGQFPDGSRASEYVGLVALRLKGGVARYGVRMLTSDTKSPDFAPLRDRLAVMPLFGYTGSATFGGRRYKIAIRGGDPATAALFVDRDGDGVMGSLPQELFDLGKPFRLDGKTYRMASFRPEGRPSVSFGPSTARVAELAMPPDLRVGRVTPSFVGRTVAGRKLAFPKDFAGKVVMIDVWATWCGPCRGEIPYLTDVYDRFGGKGFEIVSFSIDDPGMQSKVAAFAKSAGMRWPQGFSAGGFEGAVGRRFGLTSIPFSLLVDGSTGRILAKGVELRGPFLAPTVAWEMMKRR